RSGRWLVARLVRLDGSGSVTRVGYIEDDEERITRLKVRIEFERHAERVPRLAGPEDRRDDRLLYPTARLGERLDASLLVEFEATERDALITGKCLLAHGDFRTFLLHRGRSATGSAARLCLQPTDQVDGVRVRGTVGSRER